MNVCRVTLICSSNYFMIQSDITHFEWILIIFVMYVCMYIHTLINNRGPTFLFTYSEC